MKVSKQLSDLVEKLDVTPVIKEGDNYALGGDELELSLMDFKSCLLDMLGMLEMKLTASYLNHEDCVSEYKDGLKQLTDYVRQLPGLVISKTVSSWLPFFGGGASKKNPMEVLIKNIHDVVALLYTIHAAKLVYIDDNVDAKCEILNEIERINKLTLYLLRKFPDNISKPYDEIMNGYVVESFNLHAESKHALLSAINNSPKQETKAETKSDAEQASSEQAYNNSSWLEVLEIVNNASNNASQLK